MEEVFDKGQQQVEEKQGYRMTRTGDNITNDGTDGLKDGVENKMDGAKKDGNVKESIGNGVKEGLTEKKNECAPVDEEYNNGIDNNKKKGDGGGVKTATAENQRKNQTQGQQHFSTYCSRERMHMEREKEGEVCASYVTNDGQAESGKMLIGLKNIFSKCLPNMPKTYIARLVFDRRHR